MKKQATVVALGAVLSLALTATSFAATAHHAKQTRPAVGYYDSAVPEGSYSGYSNSNSSGGISGAIGGIGR
jgi:hypothetical protein